MLPFLGEKGGCFSVGAARMGKSLNSYRRGLRAALL